MDDLRERASLLALVSKADGDWHQIAAMVEEMGSATAVLELAWTGFESFDTEAAEQLGGRVDDDAIKEAEDLISTYEERGVQIVTVLDSDYPANLRQVYNRPPFLFIKGKLAADDDRSIAVVGTRQASPEGIASAGALAKQLVTHGITVLSGLAKGIDAGAHQATLDAGGRTVAVMGTGIDRIYPEENEALAERVLDQGGALVSQFWPWAPPTRFSFPMRNVVMSGMAIGTAVIEASARSGAKMQARLAVEHGKRLFLMASLVSQEEWAQRYSQHPAALVVDSVEDIVSVVASTVDLPQQLSL